MFGTGVLPLGKYGTDLEALFQGADAIELLDFHLLTDVDRLAAHHLHAPQIKLGNFDKHDRCDKRDKHSKHGRKYETTRQVSGTCHPISPCTRTSRC